MNGNDARVAGLNRFFTGSPCRNGHVCERIATTGKCVECHRATKQRYDLNHPNRKRARMRNWQAKNRPKVRSANRRWAEKNQDNLRENSSRHYAKCKTSPEKMKERSLKTRVWRIKNPEKHSAQSCRWQAENPVKAGAIQAARRARKVAAKGRYTKNDVDKLFRLQDGKCAMSWCRKSIKGKFHVDHVIPLALGGSNEPTNLQLLCPSCNCSKGAKHPIAFAQQNGMLL